MREPLLKWPGGKRTLAEQIRRVFDGPPADSYAEPFAGGLAVYLARFEAGEMQDRFVLLSDLNARLMSFYRAVRVSPDLLIQELKTLPVEDWREQFDSIRTVLNGWSPDNYEQATPYYAARYLWYNRACFNGLMRVNKKNELNAPMGSYETVVLPSEAHIRGVSQALKPAILVTRSYLELDIPSGAQIYVDPPYHNAWADYTPEGFDFVNQLQLSLWAHHQQKDRGSKVVISNADTPEVRMLYRGVGLELRTIQATRSVSCTSKSRGKTGEILAWSV
jgi:DNA adenine methylase